MRTRKQLLPFIAVGAFLALAAGGLLIGWNMAGDGTKEAGRQSPAPSRSVAGDPKAKEACDMIETAFEDDHSWNDHLFVLNIVKASKGSSNLDISSNGAVLELRLALASAAQGQPDQPEMDRKLHESMKELERSCQRAGLL